MTSFYGRESSVGTTTTVVHLVRAAARAGHRVLVVESDNIGNLSLNLTCEPLPGASAPRAAPQHRQQRSRQPGHLPTDTPGHALRVP
ncbi:ParA family protein [Prescottella agglutinans]|uniref:ParA family protein n=1 Tax=Prescottella agglutinans TaxID=1644129 RepID=UPI003CC8C7F1